MTEEPQKTLFRPMLLIVPGAMTPKDIKRAERLAGIVIVECQEPTAVRFCEPPITPNVSEHARAALELLRWIMVQPGADFNRSTLTKFYVNCLLSGGKVETVDKTQRVSKP